MTDWTIYPKDMVMTKEILDRQQRWFDVIEEVASFREFRSLQQKLDWLAALPKLPPSDRVQRRWLIAQRDAALGVDHVLTAGPALEIATHNLVSLDAHGACCSCGERMKDWRDHLADVAFAAFNLEPTRREKAHFNKEQLAIAHAAADKAHNERNAA